MAMLKLPPAKPPPTNASPEAGRRPEVMPDLFAVVIDLGERALS